jgi:hypothetical protein
MSYKPLVLKILCEGQTEELFIKQVVAPYFSDLVISPINMCGGICFDRISIFIKPLLKDNVYITTFVDFYGFNEKDLKECKLACPIQKANLAQQKLQEYIFNKYPNLAKELFIPYIQPYEFEGLLFSDVNKFLGFEKYISELEKIRQEFLTPEHINNSRETAPSKRLFKLFGENQYGKDCQKHWFRKN